MQHLNIDGEKMKAKVILSLMASFLISNACFANNDAWQRSYTLEAAGQYIAAAEAIEPILKQTPSNEFAELRSGWLHYLAANYSRSISHYQTALKINNLSIDAMLGISLPLMAQSRWREASRYLNDVIKQSKWNYYAHTRLMTCEENMKKWQELKKHTEEVLLRYPSDATVLVYMARAQAKTNEGEKAKETYKKVLQRYPTHLEATKFLAK